MSTPANSPALPLQVSCLCAQWCGTCQQYTSLFEALRRQPEFAAVQFHWIDIEDQSELVDPVDVDNFPTLLIARGGCAEFFGSITPQPETLRRMVQAHLEQPAAAWPDASVQALAQRLATLAA